MKWRPAETEDWAALSERYKRAKLRFTPLGMPRGCVVAANLDRAMIRRVAGSAQTRALLQSIDAAIEHRGTVEMANECIAVVYGIAGALTWYPAN